MERLLKRLVLELAEEWAKKQGVQKLKKFAQDPMPSALCPLPISGYKMDLWVRSVRQPPEQAPKAKWLSKITLNDCPSPFALCPIWKGIRVARRKRGPSAKPPTEPVLRQRERFLLTSAYAKEVGLDPQRKRLYETLTAGQPTTWRALAVQDFLTPPLIARVDVDEYSGQAGQRIDLFVHDATCQRVKVTVLDPAGGGGANNLGSVVEGEL